MSLIDATYFMGKRSIGGSSDTDDLLESDFIPVYEREYLIKALGYTLYSAFIAALAGTPAQKWLDLKNGVDYVVGDRTCRWDGFVNTLKISPIADYVYIQYMTDNATLTTASGESRNKQQNADNVSPAMKIWTASTDMNKKNESLWHYLANNTDTFTEYKSSEVQCFGSYNSFGL